MLLDENRHGQVASFLLWRDEEAAGLMLISAGIVFLATDEYLERAARTGQQKSAG